MAFQSILSWGYVTLNQHSLFSNVEHLQLNILNTLIPQELKMKIP